MAELDTKLATFKAKAMYEWSCFFKGMAFDSNQSPDRIALGIALNHLDDATAMVMNLAERLDVALAELAARKPVHLDMCSSQDDTMQGYPACDCGAASPAPEPLTPAAGVSEPPICPHCSKPAFAWPESAIRRGRHVVGGVVVYHCREAAVDD